MRKYFIIAALAICTVLSGCQASIGGENKPINNKIQTGEYKGRAEKDSVRMVRINGALYYEASEDIDRNGNDGAMDGSFTKGVDRFMVPQKDNESNFSGADSYRIGSENTILIPMGDEYEIFRKIDTNSNVTEYKYCFILEGRTPNAADDTELLVLANEENITFEDASNVLLSSDTAKMKDLYVLPIDD
ncbi:MAG: hypothetical protein PUE13_07995 [Clostridiales bacterium]|nr:hypothetical protein [Clostridiales bacterium]